MKDYDYFRENLQEVMEQYVKLKCCFLIGITFCGELEIEEPSGYTLIVDSDTSALYDSEDEINISLSSFKDKEIEFLQLLAKQYKNIGETEKFAEKEFEDLQYSFKLYEKQIKG